MLQAEVGLTGNNDLLGACNPETVSTAQGNHLYQTHTVLCHNSTRKHRSSALAADAKLAQPPCAAPIRPPPAPTPRAPLLLLLTTPLAAPLVVVFEAAAGRSDAHVGARCAKVLQDERAQALHALAVRAFKNMWLSLAGCVAAPTGALKQLARQCASMHALC